MPKASPRRHPKAAHLIKSNRMRHPEAPRFDQRGEGSGADHIRIDQTFAALHSGLRNDAIYTRSR